MVSKEVRLAADLAVDPIFFYRPQDEWGIFSNFSKHEIWLPHPFTGGMISYPSSEHRFQAMKATSEYHHDLCVWKPDGTPLSCSESKTMGRTVLLREDWGQDKNTICWFVMVEALVAKAIQNVAMTNALHLSGDSHIYEDSPVDDIWGWRHRNDYRGKNLLGEALMHVRDLLGL